MMRPMIDDLALLIQRGGYVMIPLLVMSLISLPLLVERGSSWLAMAGSPAAAHPHSASSAAAA